MSVKKLEKADDIIPYFENENFNIVLHCPYAHKNGVRVICIMERPRDYVERIKKILEGIVKCSFCRNSIVNTLDYFRSNERVYFVIDDNSNDAGRTTWGCGQNSCKECLIKIVLDQKTAIGQKIDDNNIIKDLNQRMLDLGNRAMHPHRRCVQPEFFSTFFELKRHQCCTLEYLPMSSKQ